MVAEHRFCAFGAIADGEMRMNVIGEMAERWWREIPKAFPGVTTDESVVMPNHFHGIIVIHEPGDSVGADLRVCPDGSGEGVTGAEEGDFMGGHVGPPERLGRHAGLPQPAPQPEGRHAGLPQQRPALPRIIQWFKTMTTNEYIRGVKQYAWPNFPGHFWQRNYYEHVIRDEVDLKRIRDYIANNPAQWDHDRFHVDGARRTG